EFAQAPAFARHGAAPPAGGIARLREGQRVHGVESRFRHFAAHGFDQIQMRNRRFALLHQDAAGVQRAETRCIERGVEQAFGRTDRIVESTITTSSDSGAQSVMYLTPSSNSSCARGSEFASQSSGKYFSASRVTRSSISTCTALST